MSRSKGHWIDAGGEHSPFSIEGKKHIELNQKVKELIEECKTRNLSTEENHELRRYIEFLQIYTNSGNSYRMEKYL
jgi:DNA-binding transcriptional regulator YhcF (GntR family)